ncbi:MAG: hypothetical protein NXH82_17370 [Rhodobacteraceae bacterium]|nr:hypothetical protein [Paracoccaceae bacterium]
MTKTELNARLAKLLPMSQMKKTADIQRMVDARKPKAQRRSD